MKQQQKSVKAGAGKQWKCENQLQAHHEHTHSNQKYQCKTMPKTARQSSNTHTYHIFKCKQVLEGHTEHQKTLQLNETPQKTPNSRPMLSGSNTNKNQKTTESHWRPLETIEINENYEKYLSMTTAGTRKL